MLVSDGLTNTVSGIRVNVSGPGHDRRRTLHFVGYSECSPQLGRHTSGPGMDLDQVRWTRQKPVTLLVVLNVLIVDSWHGSNGMITDVCSMTCEDVFNERS